MNVCLPLDKDVKPERADGAGSQLQVGGQRGAGAEKGRRFIVFSSSFLTKARGDQGEEKPFLPGCGRLVGRGGSLPIPILVGRTGGRKGVCWLEIKPPPPFEKSPWGNAMQGPLKEKSETACHARPTPGTQRPGPPIA